MRIFFGRWIDGLCGIRQAEASGNWKSFGLFNESRADDCISNRIVTQIITRCGVLLLKKKLSSVLPTM